MAWFKKKESGSPAKEPELSVYTPEQLDAVQAHIQKNFGACDRILQEKTPSGIRVDIAVVPPTNERDFYTLVTVGMGARKMDVPQQLKGRADRAELVFCLPSHWNMESTEETWYWPMRWMKILARLPLREVSWLGWGHVLPGAKPLAENTKLSGMILLAPGYFGKEAEVCSLPGGEMVRFYQMIPLYPEEMQFKQEHDVQALLQQLWSSGEFSPVLDLNRPNSCRGLASEKKMAIPADKLRPLLKWDGPAGCIATDRIMIDGRPVGYMFREQPVPGLPDSGWRFFAGDETEEYMLNPENIGVYDLNTLCNYDREIMPYLTEPAGSTFYRDKEGAFQKGEPPAPEKQ